MARRRRPKQPKPQPLRDGQPIGNPPDMPARISKFNLDAAGIDIGATEHFVAVPAGRCENTVRSFGTFTADLEGLADWLLSCRIKTVAMESTGVY